MLRKLEPIDASIAVGDIVYSILYGKGVVLKTTATGNSSIVSDYTISVQFLKNTIVTYSIDGKYVTNQQPSLFKYPVDMVDDFASAIHIEYYTKG